MTLLWQVVSMLVRGDGEASLLGESALCGVLAACTSLLPAPAAPATLPRAAAGAASEPQQQSADARSASAALGAVQALGACLFTRAALLTERGGALRPAALHSLVSLFQLAWFGDAQERPSSADQAASRKEESRQEGGAGGEHAAPLLGGGSSSRDAARQAWDEGRALKAVAPGMLPNDRRQLRSALLRPVRVWVDSIAAAPPHVRTRNLAGCTMAGLYLSSCTLAGLPPSHKAAGRCPAQSVARADHRWLSLLTQSSHALDEMVQAAHSIIVGTCLDASETQ